jgi:hypothetical protein
MNELHLLSLLKAVSMAAVVMTPSGHPAIALLDQPGGSQEDLVLFSDPYLEVRLQAHLMQAKEWLGM